LGLVVANVIALVVGYVVLSGLHAVIAAYLIIRPGNIVSFFARPGGMERLVPEGVMRRLARVAPYPWLLAGLGWDDFLERGAANPLEFGRLVGGVRLLGALALLMNLSVSGFIVAMVAIA
jgi:hypothetical protein